MVEQDPWSVGPLIAVSIMVPMEGESKGFQSTPAYCRDRAAQIIRRAVYKREVFVFLGTDSIS